MSLNFASTDAMTLLAGRPVRPRLGRIRVALAASTRTVRAASAQAWCGEDIAGRTILLHAEQGLGDTLQFVRYAPMVAQRGARVVLEVQPSLVRLMQGLPGIARVVARGDALPGLIRTARC